MISALDSDNLVHLDVVTTDISSSVNKRRARKDVQSFEFFVGDDGQKFLAIVKETESFVFNMKDTGSTSVFTLQFKLDGAARVESYVNEFGTYLIFQSKDDVAHLYTIRDGVEFVLLSKHNIKQDKWIKVELPNKDMVSTQDMVCYTSSKGGQRKLVFRSFKTPGKIVKSEMTLPLIKGAVQRVVSVYQVSETLPRQIVVSVEVTHASGAVDHKAYYLLITEDSLSADFLSDFFEVTMSILGRFAIK